MSVDLSEFKVTTPVFRASYVALAEPKAFDDQKPQWTIDMLFDKSADISSLKKVIEKAAVQKFGADRKKWPKFKHPLFRDGDDERGDDAAYENVIFVKAKNKKRRPALFDRANEKLIDANDIYSGCYCRAKLLAYAYNHKTYGAGVGFSLLAVQFVKDGEPLGGGGADEGFDSIEDDGFETGAEDTDDNNLGF